MEERSLAGSEGARDGQIQSGLEAGLEELKSVNSKNTVSNQAPGVKGGGFVGPVFCSTLRCFTHTPDSITLG